MRLFQLPPFNPRTNKPEGFVLGLLFVGSLGLGLGMMLSIAITLLVWFPALPGSLRTLNWVPVPAKVEHAFSLCGKQSSVTLEFTYRVGERTFTGDQVSGGGNRPYAQTRQQCAQEEMERLRGAGSMSVYVNPRNPAQAVLHRGPFWPTGVSDDLTWVLGCLLTVHAVAALAQLLNAVWYEEIDP